MTYISLRNALSVLAKSSPFSVSTLTLRSKDALDDFKEQLFVEQDIERDLNTLLTTLHGREVIFLCGSSGDGKSEILTRCYRQYQDQFEFHLDATHSFAPHQSAIEALDELFDSRQQHGKPLILGINTGMLANYAKEGAPQHQQIKSTIEHFLSGALNLEQRPYRNGELYFLDFEQYPKFQFSDQKAYSQFAKTLMSNLTRQDEGNLFYQCARKDEETGRDLQVIANFKLLGMESVQEVIITQLFKARLIKDQFVTTRALLDLLHHLLLGPGYLFDNLFTGEENELVQRLTDFDPARMHTQELDQFVLRYELGLPDPALNDFMSVLAHWHIYFNTQDIQPGNAGSMIRLFRLLRDEDIGNNYHHQFAHHFREDLLEEYAHVWRLHKEYDGSQEKKMALRRFYANVLIAGIQRYANRNSPELVTVTDELFLGVFGAVKLTAPVELKGDYEAIRNHSDSKSANFLAKLKINECPLVPIAINLNLFELLHKLNLGYRPNKYDKNAIVLLDEIVEQVTEQAKSSRSLKFYDGERAYTAKQDDGMIAIRGMSGVA